MPYSLKTAGNAGDLSNLVVEPGGHNQTVPLSALETGFYVTELMAGASISSSATDSRGAIGFWVENGEILQPVEGVTVAGNLKDMLAGIVTIRSDTDTRGYIRTDSILVGEMTIAGESRSMRTGVCWN